MTDLAENFKKSYSSNVKSSPKCCHFGATYSSQIFARAFKLVPQVANFHKHRVTGSVTLLAYLTLKVL